MIKKPQASKASPRCARTLAVSLVSIRTWVGPRMLVWGPCTVTAVCPDSKEKRELGVGDASIEVESVHAASQPWGIRCVEPT